MSPGCTPAGGAPRTYDTMPPCTQAAQSAPEEFGYMLLSADMAASITSTDMPHSAAREPAAATQHADEEPRPAPEGISERMRSVAPSQPSDRAMWWNGRRAGTMDSVGVRSGRSADPSADMTDSVSPSRPDDSATTRRSMAHITARAPCTTKCSPNSITLPGAVYAKVSAIYPHMQYRRFINNHALPCVQIQSIVLFVLIMTVATAAGLLPVAAGQVNSVISEPSPSWPCLTARGDLNTVWCILRFQHDGIRQFRPAVSRAGVLARAYAVLWYGWRRPPCTLCLWPVRRVAGCRT